MRKLDPNFLECLEETGIRKQIPYNASLAVAGGAASKRLPPVLAQILEQVERESFPDEVRSSGELNEAVKRAATRLGFELTNIERDEILAHLENDGKPFGLLQGLVDDSTVSDIIITNFAKIAIQQGRRNLVTDLSFPSQESYEAFVERLLQRAGSTYSTKKPIADGMIGNFARVHVVHRSICESGPYLTIRLNRFPVVSVEDLVSAGVAAQGVFNYLQGMIRIGKTLLIVGEVGTGKTTLARALASGIPFNESILVIEDTPEIRLEHPHVRYITTREANTDDAGRVDPSQCIRAGMRMAMNRIIFGEMRDAEAAEAFIDVCSSGHPGLSTIHARSASDAVARLELFLGRAQRGVTRQVLSEQIATAVQTVVHIDICRESGGRRIMQVQEIGPFVDGVMRQREMFRYQYEKGIPGWRVVNRVSAHREELENLSEAVHLSRLPARLELELNEMYRRAAQGCV
ncbi:MAG: CpaF family protein [Bdellovibrionales bacterium]|nr:CpaF family protein [Bdellovibrionales bacterium]